MYLYRQMVLNYGLWDQVRTDHGREFYLVLAMQELLAHLRNDPSKDPHRQTTSKKVSKYNFFMTISFFSY